MEAYTLMRLREGFEKVASAHKAPDNFIMGDRVGTRWSHGFQVPNSFGEKGVDASIEQLCANARQEFSGTNVYVLRPSITVYEEHDCTFGCVVVYTVPT
jgi:hypothetical protein